MQRSDIDPRLSPACMVKYIQQDRYEIAPHIEEIDNNLLWLTTTPNSRLVIQMAPRHGKSEIGAKNYPAFFLGHNPTADVILTSATDRLAKAFSLKCRDVLEEWGPAMFGIRVRRDKRAASEWKLRQGGGMIAAGVGGSIMGEGADLLVCDDYFKNVEACLSEDQRDKLWDWWLTTARTRLSPTGRILIIATRWHDDDLIGRQLKEAEDTGEQWRVVNLPAILNECEERDENLASPEAAAAERAIWPNRWSLAAMREERTRRRINGKLWMWDALYGQRPPTSLASEWPKEYWDEIWGEWPEDGQQFAQLVMVDPSKGKTDKSDYSAIFTIAKGKDRRYYVRGSMDRRNPLQIVQDACAMAERERARCIGCEINQFQEVLASLMEIELDKRNLAVDVRGINNTLPKITRIRQLTGLLASGKIKLCESPGARLCLDQLKMFPHGTHDDGPDCIEMGIRMIEIILRNTASGDEYRVQTAAMPEESYG